MKRIFSFCLAILCAFAISVPSHAYDVQRAPENTSVEAIPIATFTRSEYDIYQELQATPVAELLETGYSEEDIKAIKSTSIETLIFERAQLSEDELCGLGYTQEAIAILKEYDGSPLSQNPQLRSILATMTGRLTATRYTRTDMEARFNWEWSSAPLLCGLATIDVVACGVAGTGTNGIARTITVDTSKTSCGIYYYYQGTYYGYVAQSISAKEPHQMANSSFPMSKEYDNGLILAWAKRGDFTVRINEETPASELYSTTFAFGYAHSTIKTAPSISISPGSSFPGGVGLSFSSNSEEMFYQTIIIKNDGSYKIYT